MKNSYGTPSTTKSAPYGEKSSKDTKAAQPRVIDHQAEADKICKTTKSKMGGSGGY